MNYENIYNALVEKAKARGLDKSQHEGYFEIHHILPKCLGGSDEKDNLVMFTGREHFIAHMLLWKAYPDNDSLVSAAFFMRNTRDERNKFSSKLYENLKDANSKAMSERHSGKNAPLFKDLTGLKFSRLQVIEFDSWSLDTTGAQRSMWNCLCDCGNYVSVLGASLLIQNTKSCGCYKKEIHTMTHKRYNFSRKLQLVYHGIIGRSKNIQEDFCESWGNEQTGMTSFAEDMGEPPEGLRIGRINPNLPYSKENCKWMTTSEVGIYSKRNKRNKSGKTGVRFISKRNAWFCEICVDGRVTYLGQFETFEEAKAKREFAELQHFGMVLDG